MSHEPRQRRSWLIFDVGQNFVMTFILRVLIALWIIEASFGTAFAEMLVRHAAPELMPSPEFPKDKKGDKRSGIVHFYVRVEEAGAVVVSRVSPTSSVGFVDVVRTAVSRWRFHPALRSNKRVSEILEFVVLFHKREGVQIRGPISAVQERPNKAPEPTPTSVTPRATESTSK